MNKPAVTYAKIWASVSRIPRGKVATYGQIARIAKLPGHARQVGYAMFGLPSHTRVPWHRVINAKGEISRRKRGGGELTQRALLEKEGVRFSWRGRVDLKQYGWEPGARR